jgi:hypothetical protein
MATPFFEDLAQGALAGPRRDRLDHRAQRPRGLAAAADDLAEVRLGDLELVDVRRALLDELDPDLVRPVDEVDREVADQLGEVRRAVRAIAAVAAIVIISVPAPGAVRRRARWRRHPRPSWPERLPRSLRAARGG